MVPDLRPMSEFDPTQKVEVHDPVSDELIPWEPDWAEKYKAEAKEHSPGVMSYNGSLIDGWAPIPEEAPAPAVEPETGRLWQSP